VVTLPQSVLDPVGLREGDRVILEAVPPLMITKEGESMRATQQLEMEVDLLSKKKTAIESDLRYKQEQINSNMPCDSDMADSSVATLIMFGLARDRDRLDVQLAERRIQLYDILGDNGTDHFQMVENSAEVAKPARTQQAHLPVVSAADFWAAPAKFSSRPGIARILELLKEVGANSSSTAAKRDWLDSEVIDKVEGVKNHSAVSFALIKLKQLGIIDYAGKPIHSVWLT
jgi:hypothetical protein